ncbi:MAG: polysaccharide biosynthesis C-terminal domain-containing protein, partial [Firmicutes bacterium]|nr:polysaccharide biosynthesis C-terminal domain-containing protein [Bacillota bacterium]
MAKEKNTDKKYLFESMPIPRALATLAVPTIISQMISVIYNMVDTFYIGRAGNPLMLAATSISLTVMLLNISFSNLFGIGGGSLMARLLGQQRMEETRTVCAFSVYGAAAIAILYSAVIGIFQQPILRFLGASEDTIGFASQYTLYVVVIGCVFSTLSMTLAFLLRNTGYSGKASIGLSGGGILNMVLDPLFMFVILPRGMEVTGAAVATLISNVCSCVYLLMAVKKASASAPLSLKPSDARRISRENVKKLFAVGVPSAILTGLFDISNVVMNKLASMHGDLILAGIGIVMKIDRIPNGVNVGLSQGMLPLVAYNFASGDHERMRKAIRFTRICGVTVSAICIVLLEIFAKPVTHLFLSTSKGSAEAALATVAFAATFLRIRCLASPFAFLNYSSSYCMQAMGNGGGTMIHAIARQVVFYIPFMFILDNIFGELGLAGALPAAVLIGAVVAIVLVSRTMKKAM